MSSKYDISLTVYGNKTALVELLNKFNDHVNVCFNDNTITDLNDLCYRSKEITGKPLWDNDTGEFFLRADQAEWGEDVLLSDFFWWFFMEAVDLGLPVEYALIGQETDNVVMYQEEGVNGKCEYRFNLRRYVEYK